jgi:8-oxo-dGTP pyrophosphatase MutT (NUDIX family)
MQHILEIKKNPQWAPPGSEILIIKDNQIPPVELIATVHVLCFQSNRILMALHRERGWDVPGGHVEPGEALENAIIRETMEETGASITNIRPIAHIKLLINANKPVDWKYPYPVGFLLFFYADFIKFESFHQNHETIDKNLFSPDEVQNIPWINEFNTLYKLGITESAKSIF